jgi:hypothetical protein
MRCDSQSIELPLEDKKEDLILIEKVKHNPNKRRGNPFLITKEN